MPCLKEGGGTSLRSKWEVDSWKHHWASHKELIDQLRNPTTKTPFQARTALGLWSRDSNFRLWLQLGASKVFGSSSGSKMIWSFENRKPLFLCTTRLANKLGLWKWNPNFSSGFSSIISKRFALAPALSIQNCLGSTQEAVSFMTLIFSATSALTITTVT